MDFKILTVGEMPSHNHSASTNTTGNHNHTVSLYTTVSNAGNSGGAIGMQTDYRVHTGGYTNTTGNHNHTVSIGNTGSSQKHNNMQPYLSVYMWKRVS